MRPEILANTRLFQRDPEGFLRLKDYLAVLA